jgi:hypothetical protein
MTDFRLLPYDLTTTARFSTVLGDAQARKLLEALPDDTVKGVC